jgi:hypothetical protein
MGEVHSVLVHPSFKDAVMALLALDSVKCSSVCKTSTFMVFNIRFLTELKKTTIEAYQLCQAYGDDPPDEDSVFEKHRIFLEGRE